MTTPQGPRPGPIPRREQVLGLAAIILALVLLGLALQGWRGRDADGPATPAPAPAATPSETPTPTPSVSAWEIPDEARTSVYRSGTPASGAFASTTLALEPTTPAPTTHAYTVRVETSANVDPDAAARQIQAVLDDPRSWVGFGNNNFRLVAEGAEASLTITIATPETVDALCGPRAKTEGLWSCRKGTGAGTQVVLNSDRWHFMVPNFNNLDEYRAWLVNHYTGGYLGQRFAFCSRPGGPAPAMMQQEVDLDGCLPNAWPKLD